MSHSRPISPVGMGLADRSGLRAATSAAELGREAWAPALVLQRGVMLATAVPPQVSTYLDTPARLPRVAKPRGLGYIALQDLQWDVTR